MLTPEQAMNLVGELDKKVCLLYDQIGDPRHDMMRHYGKEANEELQQAIGSVGIFIEELNEKLKEYNEDLKRLGFTEEAMREQLRIDHENALKIWMEQVRRDGAAPS